MCSVCLLRFAKMEDKFHCPVSTTSSRRKNHNASFPSKQVQVSHENKQWTMKNYNSVIPCLNFHFPILILDEFQMCILPLSRAENFKRSPHIPVELLLLFRFLASTPCAVVSGSEEVPVQSRNFHGVMITCFLHHG